MRHERDGPFADIEKGITLQCITGLTLVLPSGVSGLTTHLSMHIYATVVLNRNRKGVGKTAKVKYLVFE